MSFPRYKDYKNSGIEWLGPVPNHWNVEACRGVLLERNERNDPLINENYLSLMANIGIILYEEKGDIGNKKPENLGKCKQVYPGDLVINSMNYGIGSYGLSKHRGICSPVYIVLTPKLEKIEERYAFRILEIKKFQQYAQSFGNGILEHRASISWDILKGIGLPIPPIEEQRKILGFLDDEIAKIDTLVLEQENLIELLREKSQAVISHAVTKGLDTTTKMKDSGIEWLGEIPNHWTVRKGASIGALFGSEQIPEEDVLSTGDVPFLKVGSLSSDSFEIQNWDWFISEKVAERIRPRSNYIVFPKRGAAIFLNKVNIVTKPSVIDPNLMGWKIFDIAIPKFIGFVLKSRKLEQLADVSTVPQINNKHIAPEQFPLPPIDEQMKIVLFLEQELEKMNILLASSENVIQLLQERRSALISDAVTGQIDVRNYKQKEAA